MDTEIQIGPTGQQAAAADPGQRPYGCRQRTPGAGTSGHQGHRAWPKTAAGGRPGPGRAADPDPVRQAGPAALHLAPGLRPRVRAGAAPGRRADRLLAGLHPAPEDLLRQRGADRGGQRGRVPGDRPAGRWSTPDRCGPPSTRRSRPASTCSRPSVAAGGGGAWPTASTRRTGASSCPASTRPTLRARRWRPSWTPPRCWSSG